MTKAQLRILIILMLSSSVFSNAIYGEIINADNFTKLNNTVIRIDGQITEQFTADGQYSVDLEPGSYTFTAVHYSNGKVDYIDKENVSVNGSQTRFDLVLIPYDLYLITPQQHSDVAAVANDTSLPAPAQPDSNPVSPAPDQSIFLIIGGLLVIGSIALVYILVRRKTVNNSEEAYLPDEEARLMLKIIRENEGRMYQKELRGILNWSEAKMSVTVSELESAGLIKRIKKGRDNLLKMTEGAGQTEKPS